MYVNGKSLDIFYLLLNQLTFHSFPPSSDSFPFLWSSSILFTLAARSTTHTCLPHNYYVPSFLCFPFPFLQSYFFSLLPLMPTITLLLSCCLFYFSSQLRATKRENKSTIKGKNIRLTEKL